MVSRRLLLVIVGVGVLFLVACGPKAVAPEAELDTPGHHVKNGNKLIKSGKIEAAYREFNRAKKLDPKYSPAYVGLGLVYGLQGEYDNSIKALKTANRYADGKEQKTDVNVGYMRLYIFGKEKLKQDWLGEVESRFYSAIRILPERPDPYFYMGIAYKLSYKLQKAADQFSKVLEIDRDYVKEADKEYAIIQQIQRAMPGSAVGKKIALLAKITRADAAALFIEELEIDMFFKKRSSLTYDTAFKSPEKAIAAGQYVQTPPATDIENHVLKADIDAVIAMGVKGLQPFPDHTFRPDNVVTRAEFAMMIEDILIKISGDDGLATKFIGNASPFPDLRNDLPYFNAVMVCVTRNILATQDVATGEFEPLTAVSGAEALLSIRALKTQL